MQLSMNLPSFSSPIAQKSNFAKHAFPIILYRQLAMYIRLYYVAGYE